MIDKFVLDTNLFFNLETGFTFGKKTEEVTTRFTQLAKTALVQKKAIFFMPPRVRDEFLSFFDNKKQDFIKDFFSVITIQSPNINSLNFPADIFYRLIENIRQRSYQGLNIGEEEIIKAGQLFNLKKTQEKKDFELTLGPIIKNYRERYRKTTRFGFIDSLTDLDLIVLSKELDAYLLSADEGVMLWGRLFGIKEMSVEVWEKKVVNLLV